MPRSSPSSRRPTRRGRSRSPACVSSSSWPIAVSRLRLKLELAARGLLPEVDQAVQAAGAVPQIYWAEATEFESDHPLVLQIGTVLGLSPADIRSLFEAAAARDA